MANSVYIRENFLREMQDFTLVINLQITCQTFKENILTYLPVSPKSSIILPIDAYCPILRSPPLKVCGYAVIADFIKVSPYVLFRLSTYTIINHLIINLKRLYFTGFSLKIIFVITTFNLVISDQYLPLKISVGAYPKSESCVK